MKTIIDEETGELIEVEENNEIAEKKLLEVGAIDETTYELLESYLTAKEQFEMFKFKLLQAMKENNIKSWKNDYFIATVKAEGMKKSVDTERLKNDGIYEKYLKLSPVKESLMIRFRGNKND